MQSLAVEATYFHSDLVPLARLAFTLAMSASDNIAPFEGPEKLLEIWFAPHAGALPPILAHADVHSDDPSRPGLRAVKRHVWESMLAIVKCKVLSVVSGAHIDAYLLSESSLFVFPHKLILKTCGTTLNLLGLPRILDIARDLCGLSRVWRCFYSRKSFMFPERQSGPHTDWTAEVKFLDEIFGPTGGGAAYTVGKVNGDHWLLYMTTPHGPDADIEIEQPEGIPEDDVDAPEDYTIELLMSDLALPARTPFFTEELPVDDDAAAQAHGIALSDQLGITAIFPPTATKLDAYAFTPCGYSANALVALPTTAPGLQHQPHDVPEGYYTIHVTPEEGWSYASFECNVQLRAAPAHRRRLPGGQIEMPDLQTLVQRVVNVFQPGRLSVTLFVSAPADSPPPSPLSSGSVPTSSSSHVTSEADQEDVTAVPLRPNAPVRSDTSTTLTTSSISTTGSSAIENDGEYAAHRQMVDLDELFPEGQVERAQRAFLQALAARGYRRTDKINYEFGGYDLAFASFELKGRGKGALKARSPPVSSAAL